MDETGKTPSSIPINATTLRTLGDGLAMDCYNYLTIKKGGACRRLLPTSCYRPASGEVEIVHCEVILCDPAQGDRRPVSILELSAGGCVVDRSHKCREIREGV